MLPYITQDILAVLPYLKNAIILSLAFSILYIIISIRNKNFSWPRVIVYALFFVYIVVVVETALLSREPGSRTAMDLKLFSTWGVTYQAHAYVIENIIFFLPMGFLLPVLFKVQRKFPVFVISTFICSFAIESAQKITGRGYFQTDDIVTNVLGALIGFMIWFCFIHLHKRRRERMRFSNIQQK